MRLAEIITDPDAGIDAIAELLDGLDGAGRWDHLGRLDRAQQRALYRKASPDALRVSDLVPGAGLRAEVIHDGLNTLSLPPPLRRFQKRFCRPDEPGSTRLFGYNEGPTRRLLGPGYFVVTGTDGSPLRGESTVMVDYYRVPDGPVVDGWPTVVPNTQGLQRHVYRETRDLLRRVSAHVSVGAAYKRDEPMDHYFVLCRRA
jgi:hypothetical protein